MLGAQAPASSKKPSGKTKHNLMGGGAYGTSNLPANRCDNSSLGVTFER